MNIFGREFLNNGSGQKTVSKLQRPRTGRASAWELTERKISLPSFRQK